MTTEGCLTLIEFFIGLILLYGIGYLIGHILNLDNHKKTKS
jgi:hypothetical protein